MCSSWSALVILSVCLVSLLTVQAFPAKLPAQWHWSIDDGGMNTFERDQKNANSPINPAVWFMNTDKMKRHMSPGMWFSQSDDDFKKRTMAGMYEYLMAKNHRRPQEGQ